MSTNFHYKRDCASLIGWLCIIDWLQAVTEEKFSILFQSTFNVGGNDLVFQVWVRSANCDGEISANCDSKISASCEISASCDWNFSQL